MAGADLDARAVAAEYFDRDGTGPPPTSRGSRRGAEAGLRRAVWDRLASAGLDAGPRFRLAQHRVCVVPGPRGKGSDESDDAAYLSASLRLAGAAVGESVSDDTGLVLLLGPAASGAAALRQLAAAGLLAHSNARLMQARLLSGALHLVAHRCSGLSGFCAGDGGKGGEDGGDWGRVSVMCCGGCSWGFGGLREGTSNKERGSRGLGRGDGNDPDWRLSLRRPGPPQPTADQARSCMNWHCCRWALDAIRAALDGAELPDPGGEWRLGAAGKRRGRRCQRSPRPATAALT